VALRHQGLESELIRGVKTPQAANYSGHRIPCCHRRAIMLEPVSRRDIVRVMAVRIANLVTLGLCLLAAALIVAGLPAALDHYTHEPEDVWLLEIELAYCLMLGTLCFANARATSNHRSSKRRLLAYCSGMMVLLILVLMIVGRQDPIVILIGCLSLIGPIAMIAGADSLDSRPL